MCSELAMFSFYHSKSMEGTGVLWSQRAMHSNIGLAHSGVSHLLTGESHVQGNMANAEQMPKTNACSEDSSEWLERTWISWLLTTAAAPHSNLTGLKKCPVSSSESRFQEVASALFTTKNSETLQPPCGSIVLSNSLRFISDCS